MKNKVKKTLDFIEYFPDEKKEKEIMIKCN